MALFRSSGADGTGALRIGSVLIDLKAPGVRFGKRSTFMSDEEWAQIYFDNVFVPANLIWQPDSDRCCRCPAEIGPEAGARWRR